MRTLFRIVGLLLAGIAGAVLARTWLDHETGPEPQAEPARAGAAERQETEFPGLSRNAAGEVVVHLPAAAAARIGLRTAPVAAATAPLEAAAFGVVENPGPLVEEARARAVASARLAASRAEFSRLRGLAQEGDNVSRRELEAAEARFREDEAALAASQRRLRNAWGSILPGDAGQRGDLLDRLVARDAVLVEATLPAGVALPAEPEGAAVLVGDGAGGRQEAARLAPAPATEGRIQGRAFLLLVTDPAPSLQPGATVAVRLRLPGPAVAGVAIPAGAIVYDQGLSWVYLAAGEDYTRRLVHLEQPLARAWFSRDLEAGVPLVVAGAEVLLSEEQRGRIAAAVEEEQGD